MMAVPMTTLLHKKTFQNFCAFGFHKYSVPLISFLITASFLPAREEGSDKCTKTYNTMSDMIREVKPKYRSPSKKRVEMRKDCLLWGVNI